MYKEKLLELRNEEHFNQKEFAKKINIKYTTYNNNESEYEIITITNLNIICNYFNVSLDYIFGFNNERNYPKNRNEINLKLSGARLKQFRKDNNIKQVSLAIDLGCSQSIISRYEKGEIPIPTQYLYAICSKFNLSADYLLGKLDI